MVTAVTVVTASENVTLTSFLENNSVTKYEIALVTAVTTIKYL